MQKIVKNKMNGNKMKTKSLLTATAVVAAIAASTSVAKADAYLELESGAATPYVLTSGSDNVGTLNITYAGYSLTLVSGSSDDMNITLDAQDQGGSPANGLTIIYSSGSYPTISGNYSFGLTEDGNTTLGATASAYYAGSEYSGTGSYGTLLSTVTMGTQSSGVNSKNGPGGSINVANQYINEVLAIGGGASATVTGGPQHFDDTAGLDINVPDTGSTALIMGPAIGLLMGLSRKLRRTA